MPVKSNISRKKEKRYQSSRRATKSLSPPKKKNTKHLRIISSRAVLNEFDTDTDNDKCNTSYPFYRSVTSDCPKELHSDFNKKYISDNVITNSKLRWNRKVQKYSEQTDDQNEQQNILLSKIKQSPQIPSPLYSPIKPLKTTKENNGKNQLSISLETPPSSDESSFLKIHEMKSDVKLSPSRTFVETKISKNYNVHKISKKSKNTIIKIDDANDKKSNKRKPQSRKMLKNDAKLNSSKTVKAIKNMEKPSQYFIDEEYLNMENVLETESEKSYFPMVTSPTSMSLGMVSTPSPDNTIVDDIHLESRYFLKEKSPPQVEINKLKSFKNNFNDIESQNIQEETKNIEKELLMKEPEFLGNTANKNKYSAETLENKESTDKNSFNVKADKKLFSEITSVEWKIDNTDNSLVLDTRNSPQMIIKEISNQKNINENLYKNAILFTNEESNISLQKSSNCGENNEVFNYSILNNRISSLKLPISTDSGKGSSIDVETNYHPKRYEIFWARKKNCPYWPCLIWPDHEEKTLKIEKQIHRQIICYHVKFFADNGQRGWIYKNNLIAYAGREDFERRAKEQFLKMKSSIYKKYFVVTRAKLPSWEQAVKEADRILGVHIEKRAEMFNEMLRESAELLGIHKQQKHLTISIDTNSSCLTQNSINESSEDLLNTSMDSSFSMVPKRRHSSSIHENLAKRHKIESDYEEVLQPKTLATINTESTKFSFPKELVDVMADYTLRTTENNSSFQRFGCIELFHIATLKEFDSGTDSNQSNKNDHSYLSVTSGLLKQLHFDFNKKYISDNVTINSKLRWNRHIKQYPGQTGDQNEEKNIISKINQIPSPLYSPIKPLRKQPNENTRKNQLQISLETPTSSDESSFLKLHEMSSEVKLSPSHSFLEAKMPINNKLLKILRKSKNTELSTKIQNVNSKNSTNKRKIQSQKIYKNDCSKIKGKATTSMENTSQYFIDEEYLNMENVLETESEKSYFPILASPISMSLGMVSTPSPDNTVVDDIHLESRYFLKEKFPSPIEIKNKLESLKNNLNNIESQKIIEESKNSIKKESMKETKFSDNNTTNNNQFSDETVENKESNEENSLYVDIKGDQKLFSKTDIISVNLKGDNIENCLVLDTINNSKIVIEENSNNKNMNKNIYENAILFTNKEDNIGIQESSNSGQNNEVYNYPILHNRISSLKSPISTDSAQGSSIDVETNYHPKHYEIFWGRKGNFPYWPCLIWPDPEGKTLKIEKQTHRQFICYHVKFFADNGQRGWIYKDNLIAYAGREDFERRAKEQSLKMKSSIYRKYFVVTRAKLPIWEQAVKEADRILGVHIEKRAEMFNEILGESVELLRIHKQQRRLTVSLDRSLSRLSQNSINESTEDLLNTSGISSSFSMVSKRRRSSSVYENLAKRHKTESDSDDVLQQETLATINTENGKYSFPKELVEVMADYTLRTSENNSSFQRFENCCTELFHIIKDSIHEECEKGANLKKHPNRILRKQLIGKLQKQYKEIVSKPVMNVEKVKRKRAISDAPSIQNVLKDIIDLLEDKFYLFRHLKKGAVCKICLKSNNLLKCAGHCDSWLHKCCSEFTAEEYSEKLKLESKKKRGKKLPLINELFQSKDDIETQTVFRHVVGDVEKDLAISTKVEEIDGANQNESIATEYAAPENVSCKQCAMDLEPFCFICSTSKKDLKSFESSSSEISKTNEFTNETNFETLIKCKLALCNKYYHLSCLKVWPRTYITKVKDLTNKESLYSQKIELICPSHTCHTCVSEEPHHIQLGKNNIIKCVKCPATYHFHSKCIPAGTEFLTANTIICPRHNEEIKPTNTDWCFLCSESGDLICCDHCPSSFHLNCLKLNQTPKEKFLCELCQNGCLPLYGDLVWCKFSQFKWWPSVIIPPPIIPKNLYKKVHTRFLSRFGFCVRFLGTNDYAWTGRHRVYLYQEDDYSFDKKKDKTLQKAIDEAKAAWDYFEINKPKRGNIEEASTPLPYKKIKNNLPLPPVKLEYNINELNTICECSPNSKSPCGYDSQCLNRVLMIECNPKICPAKFNCENQMFEKREYAPITIRKTIGKGFGLVCIAPVSAGSFIIEYVGELIDDNELKRRIEEKQKENDPHYYFFNIESNLNIDAGPKGNLARFMNHSCEPNCEPQIWTVNGVKRIGLFAKYDIKEDTELTFHYNFECVGDNKVVCHCGAENCEGFIGGIYNKKSNDLKNLPQEKSNITTTSTTTQSSKASSNSKHGKFKIKISK